MIAAMNYLLQTNTALILFYIVYAVFLRNENQFSFNRFFLLTGMVLSLLMPLFHFTTLFGKSLIPSFSNALSVNWLPEVIASGDSGPYASIAEPAWMTIKFVYLLMVVIMSAVFVYRLITVARKLKQVRTYWWRDCRVAESDVSEQTFSFFHFIFIGQPLLLSHQEKEKILQHEWVHVQRMHSIDILMVNLLGIICWFNPIVIFYKKALVQLHEFEADARSVKEEEVDTYCQLMAKVALEQAGFSLVSHFHNSLTIKRITMMKTLKRKIQPWKLATLAAALPVIFFVVSCQDQVKSDSFSEGKSSAAAKQLSAASSETALKTADVSPEFKGGYDALRAYLTTSIQYPASAKADGIEGKVFIEFVVEEDGTITNAKVLRGVSPQLDKEALRVVARMPNWTPGSDKGQPARVKYVVPINFHS